MKNTFEERGAKYIEEDKKLQEKFGIIRHTQLIFPDKKVIPWTGRVAIFLLKRTKARIVDGLKDAQGKVKKGKKNGNT